MCFKLESIRIMTEYTGFIIGIKPLNSIIDTFLHFFTHNSIAFARITLQISIKISCPHQFIRYDCRNDRNKCTSFEMELHSIAPPTSIPRYRIQFFGLSNKSTTCWIQGISAILTADPNKRIFSYFDAISCGIFIILLKPIHNFIDISVKISS